MRSASGVKEMCVRGQWEVHRGSGRSAFAESVVFHWSTSPWPQTHFSLTPGALRFDPWRTSPWPLTHFSLTRRAFFSELEKAKKWWKKIQNYCLKRIYILNIHALWWLKVSFQFGNPFNSIIDSTFLVSFMASVDQVAILTELNGWPLISTLVVTVYMPKSATVLDQYESTESI